MDYKIPCIDIAETQRQRARIISKYSYLFSPVNSIGFLMNAIRLRQDFSVGAMRYNLNIYYDTYYIQYKHLDTSILFYSILYHVYVQPYQQAHYKSYKDLYWHCNWPFIGVKQVL